MMLKKLKKTFLICFFCRRTIAEVLNTFIFPYVFDFCPDCEKQIMGEFERQFKP